MELNYVLIVVATLAQFALGAVWYSPFLFGNLWMTIMGHSDMSKDEMKRMQKEMAPFYGLQLLITVFSTFSFAALMVYVVDVQSYSAYHIAFWLWIGFITPTQISAVVWGNTKKKYWLRQILVMISMQLVGIMLAAWILSM